MDRSTTYDTGELRSDVQVRPVTSSPESAARQGFVTRTVPGPFYKAGSFSADAHTGARAQKEDRRAHRPGVSIDAGVTNSRGADPQVSQSVWLPHSGVAGKKYCPYRFSR
jgi:hypothetical protein